MHTHVFRSASQRAHGAVAGITTVRDMASDIDVAVSHRERAGRHDAGPRSSSLVHRGPGPLGRSQAKPRPHRGRGRAWVAHYDSLGYKQIKLYNLVHPDLVPDVRRGGAQARHAAQRTHSARAHRAGRRAARLRRVPARRVSVLDVLPGSLYVPTMRAYSVVATAVAPTFDVNAPQVTELIPFLRDRHTVGGRNVQRLAGSLPAAARWRPIRSSAGRSTRMPPLMKRGMAAGPADSPEAAARAEAGERELPSDAQAAVRRRRDADSRNGNVPGLSLHGELEVYERAGIPAPAVLQIATIVPARVMKDDKDYGRILPARSRTSRSSMESPRSASPISDGRNAWCARDACTSRRRSTRPQD